MKAYLEYEEIARLEECATNVRDRLLIRILFHLGCRVSEALGIAVEDIELTKGLISIEHLKIRSHVFCPTCHTQLGKNHRFCPSCGAQVETAVAEAREHRRMRTLPIDKTTIQMLRDYIHRGGPVERGGRKLIFGVNRHRAWQIITKCAEKAGLPKLTNPETGRVHNVSPHRLRDSFATHAIKTNDTGDGLRLLQVHLGHASFNTTAKYRKISGQEHADWYAKLWEDKNNG